MTNKNIKNQIIVDTNILYRVPATLKKLKKISNAEVCVLAATVDEIDKQKYKGTSEERLDAREALRLIEKLNLKVLEADYKFKDREFYSIVKGHTDDFIIKYVLETPEAALLTYDRNLYLKLKERSIFLNSNVKHKIRAAYELKTGLSRKNLQTTLAELPFDGRNIFVNVEKGLSNELLGIKVELTDAQKVEVLNAYKCLDIDEKVVLFDLFLSTFLIDNIKEKTFNDLVLQNGIKLKTFTS